jgi:hypothetical protein
MKPYLIFLTLLCILSSNVCWGRTEIPLPPQKVVNVALSNAAQFGLTLTLKAAEPDQNYEWLSFEVTKGIEGRAVQSALVEIYLGEEPITNFSITKIGISNAKGSKEYIVFPLNAAVVTKVIINFYCENNYVYRIEVPLSVL